MADIINNDPEPTAATHTSHILGYILSAVLGLIASEYRHWDDPKPSPAPPTPAPAPALSISGDTKVPAYGFARLELKGAPVESAEWDVASTSDPRFAVANPVTDTSGATYAFGAPPGTYRVAAYAVSGGKIRKSTATVEFAAPPTPATPDKPTPPAPPAPKPVWPTSQVTPAPRSEATPSAARTIELNWTWDVSKANWVAAWPDDTHKAPRKR